MNRLPTVQRVVLGALLLLFSLVLSSCHSAVPPSAPRLTPQASRIAPNASRIATDGSTSLTAVPNWSVTSNQGGALLGYAVASAGDVNGDGYADVIVGVPRYDLGEIEEGAAFLYLGGPEGLATSPAWIGESDQEYAWFGWAVASAGDVNGDGYADVIVGAPRYDVTGLTDAGQAFLYYGGPTGIITSTVWITHTDQAHARFGVSVSTAGDVNGDGYGDVVITANGYDGEETNEGVAFVYHGGADGLGSNPAWTDHPTDQAYANFGRSASTAGDVNGDGYSDVVVGASWYDTGPTDEDRDRGAVFVYHGGPAGLADAPSWTVTGDRREAEFGIAVASAGDVNGDNYSDLIVGAYKYTEDYEHPRREGAAFVYHGGADGLGGSPSWSGRSGQESAKFGSAVSSGDVNGDGYSDVVVGAYSYDGGQPYEGAFFVYHGGADGLAETHAWSAEGDQEGAGLGYAVSATGDV
ncbi:MAG: integrin alpha, partial [Chloroflexi bacterium]|nr:integrin alpha [Chloroflexota bacterium]